MCSMYADDPEGNAPTVSVRIENATDRHIVLVGSHGSCEGNVPVYSIDDVAMNPSFPAIGCKTARTEECLGGVQGCSQDPGPFVVIAPGGSHDAPSWNGRIVETTQMPDGCAKGMCPSSCYLRLDAPEGSYRFRAKARACTPGASCACDPLEGSACVTDYGSLGDDVELEASAMLEYPGSSSVVLIFE